jgi:hypothetical protein
MVIGVWGADWFTILGSASASEVGSTPGIRFTPGVGSIAWSGLTSGVGSEAGVGFLTILKPATGTMGAIRLGRTLKVTVLLEKVM